MPSQPDKRVLPGAIDSVLALLDYLEEYRRSWRCWLIGGPAAVDQLEIESVGVTQGLAVVAGFELEESETLHPRIPASRKHGLRWYARPHPEPPPGGAFRDDEQRFPIRGTLAHPQCRRCRGTGRRTCPACRGPHATAPAGACALCDNRGQVPCDCAETADPTAVLHYEEIRYRYCQEAHVWHVLPPEATANRLTRRFLAALDGVSGHAIFEAESVTELLDQLRAAGIADGETLETVSRRCEHGGHWVRMSRPGRVLFRRFQVRLTHGATVSLRLGRLRRPFWSIGTGDECRHWFTGIYWHQPRYLPWVAWLATLLWIYPQNLVERYWRWRTGAPSPEEDFISVFGTVCGILTWFVFLLPSKLEGVTRGLGLLLRSLVRSLHAKPAPMTVVAGHDPAASGRLFSLFAHLASAAQLASPGEGGVVLDDAWEHLPAMLGLGGAAPECSTTYRMRFGQDVPGSEQARFVHAILPPGDAPDALTRRVLGRASEVWLVLPRVGGTPEADLWARRLLEHTGTAPVTLVFDGPPLGDPLTAYPGTRDALRGRPHRCLSLDLTVLPRRYLQGDVSPEEAAALVRALSGTPTPTQTTPEETTSTEAPRVPLALRE